MIRNPARKQLLPRGPFTQVADGVFCVDANIQSIDKFRRMTVLVLPDKRLVVHSGIRLEEPEMAPIDALGNVAYYLYVPNAFHDPDASWFAERYPTARVLAPQSIIEKARMKMRVDSTLEQGWPEEFSGILRHLTIRGIRFHETAYLHVPSGTLILVDLIFNLKKEFFNGRPIGRFLMKLNHAYDRFGMTRLTQLLVCNHAAFQASLKQILTWDFDRVIVSHGAILERGGKEAVRSALSHYLD